MTGTKMEGQARSCVRTAMKAAEMDFIIEKREMFALSEEFGGRCSRTRIPNKVSLFTSGGQYLSTVSKDYSVLENRDVFLPLEALVSTGRYEIDRAGSFQEGRRAWMLLIPGEPQGALISREDTVEQNILFSTSHDGSGAVSGAIIPFRFGCENYLATALGRGDSIFLRHDTRLRDRVKDLAEFVAEAPKVLEGVIRSYRHLSQRCVTVEDVDQYVKALGLGERLAVQVFGPKPYPGWSTLSWWSVYNQYNSYLCHNKRVKTDNRYNSLWFGRAKQRNEKALELALTLAG